jgi:hypothetical protein
VRSGTVQGLIAAGPTRQNLSGLGWASLGVLELTALPTIGADRWVSWVREADVLLVDGGGATYLCHWMRESGPGRSAAVAARHGLGRSECRKHGDDAPDRGVLRRVAARAGRSNAGSHRLLDFPALEPVPYEHPGRSSAVGPPPSASRPTQSTNRPRSPSSTVRSRWCPKGSGWSSVIAFASRASRLSRRGTHSSAADRERASPSSGMARSSARAGGWRSAR